MTLTDSMIRELGTATTRDDAGRHFTEWMAYAADLEALGLIAITRPVHQAGLAYDSSHWSLEITEAGQEVVESHPDLFEATETEPLFKRTNVRGYKNVIVIAGLVNAKGEQLFGLFDSSLDVLDGDSKSFATLGRESLTADQIAIAEYNSQKLDTVIRE